MTDPILKATKHLQIQAAQLAKEMLAGAYHSAFKGQGMEFEDVREYQSGDEIRYIDWNVTARMQHPYVKRFREERQAIVFLAVDVSASMNQTANNQSKREVAAHVAGLLGACAIQNQDKVGLLLYSDKVELYIPPNRGIKHLLRIIRELLFFKAASSGTNMDYALDYLGKIHKKNSIIFILSDFVKTIQTETLPLLSRLHDVIAIAIVNEMDKDLPNIGLAVFCDQESALETTVDTSDNIARKNWSSNAATVRKNNYLQLRTAGADLIEIDTAKSYLSALRQFFRNRRKRL